MNPFEVLNHRTLNTTLRKVSKHIANQLGLSGDYLMALIFTWCRLRVSKETNLETFKLLLYLRPKLADQIVEPSHILKISTAIVSLLSYLINDIFLS